MVNLYVIDSPSDHGDLAKFIVVVAIVATVVVVVVLTFVVSRACAARAYSTT